MASSIEFKLFAPSIERVKLKGSFSDEQEIDLEKGKDGYFRTKVDLEDGYHTYKFRVQSKSYFLEPNEWVEVVDPKATNVDEAQQMAVLQVKDGQPIIDDYVWQHDDKVLPDNDELIIYELLVRDFSGGEDDPYPRGQFKHVVEKLDYLCELGINAIELMPVQEFPGDKGWGYNTRHYFAVESTYGSTTELKHLIDECHARGIRVILDIILNHSDYEAPLTQIDYEYWYLKEPKDPEFNWGPEFNYDRYDEKLDLYPAQEFAKDIVRFWITEYHIDGFRYDALRQMGHLDLVQQLAEEATQLAHPKPFYNIGELIPESPEVTHLEGPLDACWRDGFLHHLVPMLWGEGVDLEVLKDVVDARRSGYLGVVNAINYLTNHDHDHLMAQLAQHGVFDDAAFQRATFGLAVMMTALGVPLVWMGEEFGAYKSKTLEPAKIDWTLLNSDRNQILWERYRGLIRLRRENYALRTENIEFFHENPDERVLAYVRWNDEGSRVVVILNCSNQHLADYEIANFPQGDMWHEWIQDYDVNIQDGVWVTDLAAYDAKVLV